MPQLVLTRTIYIMKRFSLVSLLCLVSLAPASLAQSTVVNIDTPMPPPDWALMERALLKANSDAVEAFAEQYLDERGYLLHTPRWGTLDGPDDAIETFFNWTLLHTLGGSDSVLELYKKGLEGHLRQYGELRTELTSLSANGAYHKEFITQSDWFHTGEGMRAFFLWGHSEPENPLLVSRMKKFMAMYNDEDPEIKNYDPEKKIIKSIWNGSLGPMLRRATVYDWVGDPVPGKFNLLHNPARMGTLLDLEEWYPRMLAHCEEYLDSVGDTFLNLAATLLSVNAYALTGEQKYHDWTVEYLDAWKERAAATGGMIPSNIGLDGSLGGEHDGQWWKGTYGWNFTIFDGELQEIAHRNYFTNASFQGFANGLLMTGDQSYIDVLRKQMDLVLAAKKVENGKTLLPRMYGDPRGYKYNGEPEFYQFEPITYSDRLTEIYLWSMDRKDLARVALDDEPWVAFLEGKNPSYPIEAMQRDFEHIRERIEFMRNDPTSADTRLADYLLRVVPAATDALTELTTGGYFPGGRIWVLHSRLRYFDPDRRRAGLPEDVAALVHELSADSVTVTLVNVNQVEARDVIVQAGAYAEHQFTDSNSSALTVRLAPGAGKKLTLKMKRYANRPNLAFPWSR
jgi:hypothetical protein